MTTRYDHNPRAWQFVLRGGPGDGEPLDLWLSPDMEPPPLVVYTWWCHDRFAQALYVCYAADSAAKVIPYYWRGPVDLDPRIALEEAACPDVVDVAQASA